MGPEPLTLAIYPSSAPMRTLCTQGLASALVCWPWLAFR